MFRNYSNIMAILFCLSVSLNSFSECRDGASSDRAYMVGTVKTVVSGAQNDGFYIEIQSSAFAGCTEAFWTTDKAALSLFLTAKNNGESQKVKVIYLQTPQVNSFYDKVVNYKLLQVNLL